MADKQILIDLKIETNYEKALQQIQSLNKGIDEQKAKQKELNSALKEGTISYDEYNKEMEDSRTAVTRMAEQQRALRKEVQNNIKIEKENEGSLKQLRAALLNLTSEYDNLSKAERESAKGKELEKKINSVTKELKGAEEETGRFYRNVGNYANSIQSVIGENVDGFNKVTSAISPLSEQLKLIGNQLGKVTKDFKAATASTTGMTAAQRAATIASAGFTSALKILKIALISTGIGAIVVSLGSLITYLTRTQEGTEKLGRAFAGLKGAIDVILDRFAKFGSSFAKLLTGDFKGAVEDFKATFSGFGEELVAETKQAMALKDALTAIEKEEAKLTAQQAAQKVRVAELKRISDDTTKSIGERVKAAKEALSIEQSMAEKFNELGERRIANMLGYTEVTESVKKQIEDIKNGTSDADDVIKNLGLSESTIADYQELTFAVASYQQRVQEFAQMTVEGTTKINAILKEGQAIADAANKAVEDAANKAGIEQAELEKRAAEERRKMQEDEQSSFELSIENRLLKLEAEYATEEEMLKANSQAKREIFESLRQMEGESEEEFINRKLKAEIDYNNASLALMEYQSEEEKRIESEKQTALANLKNNAMELLDELGDKNKAFAVLSKALALGEIAVETGKAIASGVANASAVPFPGNIAAIATTVATVLANITTAIQTVKSAKFAEGGLVEGAGTGTSDSIPAMLSNGESVMTARATSMFAPVLSALNVAGGGVPIGVKEKSSQTLGEDMLAQAFSRGMSNIKPVVAVTEINRVSERVRVVESLGDV